MIDANIALADRNAKMPAEGKKISMTANAKPNTSSKMAQAQSMFAPLVPTRKLKRSVPSDFSRIPH
jgi:hypothetical protein